MACKVTFAIFSNYLLVQFKFSISKNLFQFIGMNSSIPVSVNMLMQKSSDGSLCFFILLCRSVEDCPVPKKEAPFDQFPLCFFFGRVTRRNKFFVEELDIISFFPNQIKLPCNETLSDFFVVGLYFYWFLMYSMSAIDFICSVDKVKGAHGEDRVLLTFNGKYLPHTEQVCRHFCYALRSSCMVCISLSSFHASQSAC